MAVHRDHSGEQRADGDPVKVPCPVCHENIVVERMKKTTRIDSRGSQILRTARIAEHLQPEVRTWSCKPEQKMVNIQVVCSGSNARVDIL